MLVSSIAAVELLILTVLPRATEPVTPRLTVGVEGLMVRRAWAEVFSTVTAEAELFSKVLAPVKVWVVPSWAKEPEPRPPRVPAFWA
jgi:hypothetical protein